MSQSSKSQYIQLQHNISRRVRSLTFQILLQFSITTLNWLVVWSVALWRIQQWWYIINSHEWCSGPLWSIYHLCCKIKSFSPCVQLTWTRWVKCSCFSCDHSWCLTHLVIFPHKRSTTVHQSLADASVAKQSRHVQCSLQPREDKIIWSIIMKKLWLVVYALLKSSS